MKHFITTGLVLLTALFSVHAQLPVLKSYYELKEALVNSDATSASVQAAELGKAVANTDIKAIPVNRQDAVKEIQKKLIADATRIGATKEIGKQREYFANLSLNMYALTKQEKLSDQAIYQAYCPMKKMYWLSSEKNIRNPYYGKMMLTCGSITDTINP